MTGKDFRSPQLQPPAAETDETQRQLAQLQREMQQYYHIFAHDLQSPLRAVISFLERLQQHHHHQVDERGRQYMDRSRNAAQRLQDQLQALAEMCKLTDALHPATTNLDHLLDELTREMTPLLRKRNATISRTPLPTLTVDPAHMKQLFQQLIINGVTFNTSPTPTVTVACRKETEDYLFTVGDNGIGIAPRFHERVFGIFERLHTESEYPGTGIGLALCRKIVEMHGGTIAIDSDTGSGTTVTFTVRQ